MYQPLHKSIIGVLCALGLAVFQTTALLANPPQRSVYDRGGNSGDATRVNEPQPTNDPTRNAPTNSSSDAPFSGNSLDVSPAAFQAPATAIPPNAATPAQRSEEPHAFAPPFATPLRADDRSNSSIAEPAPFRDPFANRDAFPTKQASFTTEASSGALSATADSARSAVSDAKHDNHPVKTDLKAPLKLSAADKPKPIASDTTKGETPKRGVDSVLTVLGSLGIVLGLFFVVAWGLKRGMPKNNRPLPSEAVEVLGRAVLVGKQQMHLLRLGNKLVLVAVSPTGTDTIAEVTDPAEVDRLLGLCMQSHPTSSTSSFRGIMAGYGRGTREIEVEDDEPRAKRTSLVGVYTRRGERASEVDDA